VNIDGLGVRICVMGPSGSGKSTLAEAIGRAKALPVVHLDRLRHEPGLHWQQRPDNVFADLHDEAIEADAWIIDGNYSQLLPQRLERATGLILLDASAGRA
jgi:adenylate kinase family enzyme